MQKSEHEFFPADTVPWTKPNPAVEGLSERVLAADASAPGVATRILRFAPGTDTSSAGVMRHAFWEEVYILEGAIHDLTLDRTFSVGMYACRPAGMPHGPWRSDKGCLTFEVRYPGG